MTMTAGRYSSKDEQGRYIDFFWPYRMDFKFHFVFVPVEDSDFSLEGKEITLIIQDKKSVTGVYLLKQDTGDGNITVSGLEITGDIPFADLEAAGIVEDGVYDFGMTIGDPVDGNRVQSWFRCIPETGRVSGGTNNYSVSLADFSATINLAVGPRGIDGLPDGTPAGGDLLGSYPSPIVVGLRGRSLPDIAPDDGQLLGWETAGSRWIPMTHVDAGSVQDNLNDHEEDVANPHEVTAAQAGALAQLNIVIREVTENDTATVSDCYISVVTSGNDVELTLPELGNIMLIIRHDYNSIGDNVATITNSVNGETGPWILPKGPWINLIFDGEEWTEAFNF